VTYTITVTPEIVLWCEVGTIASLSLFVCDPLHGGQMKPYTVSDNLICVDFSFDPPPNLNVGVSLADTGVLQVSFAEERAMRAACAMPFVAGQLDAYDQLNDSGEVLYISPPCDVEPNGCA
jgi:hypothetical protein